MVAPNKLCPKNSHQLTCRYCGETKTANYFFKCGGRICLECCHKGARAYQKLTGVRSPKGARRPWRSRKWVGRKSGKWNWAGVHKMPKTITNSNEQVCGWDFEYLPDQYQELARQRFARSLEKFIYRHGHEPTIKQRALLLGITVRNLYNSTLSSLYAKWCWHLYDQKRWRWKRLHWRNAAFNYRDSQPQVARAAVKNLWM